MCKCSTLTFVISVLTLWPRHDVPQVGSEAPFTWAARTVFSTFSFAREARMKLTFAALLQDTANCSGVLPSLFSTSKFVSEQSRRSLKTRGSFNYEILPDSFRKLRLSSSFYLKTPLDISRILAPIRQLRSCGENWVTTMSRVTSSKTCSCQCCDNSLPCLVLKDAFQSMVAFPFLNWLDVIYRHVP